MTSQDALIKYFVETSGITSPKAISEMLSVPYETARSWMRRYRIMRSNLTGEISPPVESHRSNPTASGEIPPVPRARVSYTEENSNIINNNTTSPASRNPSSDDIDVDDFILQKKLRDAAINQPTNEMAASLEDVTSIRDLINQGYDLESQILPTIRKHQHKGSGLISSWAYFATIIKSKHAKPDQSGPKKVRYAQEEWDPEELVSSYVN